MRKSGQLRISPCGCCPVCVRLAVCRGIFWAQKLFAHRTGPCLTYIPAKCDFVFGKRSLSPHFAKHFRKLIDLFLCGLICFFFDLDFDFLLVKFFANEGRKLFQNVFYCGFCQGICVITKLFDVQTVIGIALHASTQVHLVADNVCFSAPKFKSIHNHAPLAQRFLLRPAPK